MTSAPVAADRQMIDLFNLEGKRALVTGSSRGLGLAMAEALAAAGASVVLHGRDVDALDSAVRSFGGRGWKAEKIVCDVEDEQALRATAHAVLEEHGRIDILINNAGVNIRKGLAEATSRDWRTVLDINLTSCFVLSQELSPAMIASGWGRIVNVGSVMSIIARAGIPAYAAAKHGLAGLTKALAAELGPQRVTVNAICPGFFETEATKAHQNDPEFLARVTQRIPLGRFGMPNELGGAALFLASEAGAYVNGHLLVVDGGMTGTL